MRFNKLALSAVGSLLLCATVPAVQAAEFQAGDWTLTLGGEINANYVYTQCDDTKTTIVGVGGGVIGACNVNGLISDKGASNVRTGLLPGQLLIGAKTTQNGWDISGTFGLYPGIATNDGGSPNLGIGGGNNVALGTTGLDVRQVFLKFGNAQFGTIKAGRDFGIFGFDAIINDMTIPAVGGGSLGTGSPGNTTIGSIGFGYIYTDTLAQINYTTPNFNGTTVTVGIVQTIDPLGVTSAADVSETAPGFQGQVKHAWKTGFVSVNGLTLSANGIPDASKSGATDEERVWGIDANWKQDFDAFGVLASAYYTDGLGSVAILADSFDANGGTRKSYGGLVQGTYTVGKNKFGLNYGISYLDNNTVDPANLFKNNRKVTVGYYYSLTANLLLTSEFTHATSENHAGQEIDSDNANVGVFFSF